MTREGRHVATWRLVSAAAPDTSAALAVYQLVGDIDAAWRALGMAPVGVGGVRLRRFGDFERGVVARPADGTAVLMPHAGPAVRRRMQTWLGGAGIAAASGADPVVLFPEARTLVEARMLAALADAASPLAIDLLLDQPRRWEGQDDAREDAHTLERSGVLRRLLVPPTVVALGAPNIGKSTLLNALAKRAVAIVADVPGTTRDHVGIALDLAGLVVHYVDTPGIDAGGDGVKEIDREAQRIAMEVAARADLVLLCADHEHEFLGAPPGRSELRVGLRADLGPVAGAEVSVSARAGAGLGELVALVRERLVPAAMLEHPGAWRFWE